MITNIATTLLGGIIAVIATLTGARVARGAQRDIARENRTAEQWSLAIDLIAQVCAVLADHRTAMWELESRRYRHESAQRIQEALDATLVTRAAVSAPHLKLRLLLPALRGQLEEAVAATYRMDSAMRPEVAQVPPLDRKDAAKAALKRFQERAVEVVDRERISLAA